MSKKKKLTIKFYTVELKEILIPKNFESLKKLIFDEFCLKDLEINEIEIFYFDKENKKIIINDDDDFQTFINTENNDLILNVIEKSFKISSKEIESKNFTEKITKCISNQIEIATNNIKNLILNEDNTLDKTKLNLNVHYNFSCKNCKKEFICGYVYKCLIEDDLNLCDKCSLNHEHPMFKIK